MKLTEAQFSAQIIDLAHYLGYTVAHFRPARGIKNGKETWRTPVGADGKGFPDLVLVRPGNDPLVPGPKREGRLIFAELKRPPNQLSPEQEAWLELLKETPAKVYLWEVGK